VGRRQLALETRIFQETQENISLGSR
jgi:hypothetical protein